MITASNAQRAGWNGKQFAASKSKCNGQSLKGVWASRSVSSTCLTEEMWINALASWQLEEMRQTKAVEGRRDDKRWIPDWHYGGLLIFPSGHWRYYSSISIFRFQYKNKDFKTSGRTTVTWSWFIANPYMGDFSLMVLWTSQCRWCCCVSAPSNWLTCLEVTFSRVVPIGIVLEVWWEVTLLHLLNDPVLMLKSIALCEQLYWNEWDATLDSGGLTTAATVMSRGGDDEGVLIDPQID